MTKTAEKPYPLGPHIPISPKKENRESGDSKSGRGL